MTDVDTKVVDYYQSRSLGNDRLQEILESSRSVRKRRYAPLYAAAAVVLLAVAGFIHQQSLVSQRTSLALREAAMNHATKLQFDVEAEALESLQAGLVELPFEIELPDNPIFQQLALIGGRYCTFSGNLAAHLKFSDPESLEQYSLFVTPYSGNLASMQSDPVQLAGVEVNLWREKNSMFALARSAQSPR